MNRLQLRALLVGAVIAAPSCMTLGACSGPKPPPPVPATAAPTVTMAKLTVTTSGGNLTSTPPGIDCRSERPPWNATGTCSAAFPLGTQVTLLFTPTMAAGFAQFSVTEDGQAPGTGRIENGDRCVIMLAGDRNVTAYAVTIPPPPGGPPR